MFDDDKTDSDQSVKKPKFAVWSPEENDAFINAIRKHGKNKEKLSELFKTKTKNQVIAKLGNLAIQLNKFPNPALADIKILLSKSNINGKGKKTKDTSFKNSLIENIRKFGCDLKKLQ